MNKIRNSQKEGSYTNQRLTSFTSMLAILLGIVLSLGLVAMPASADVYVEDLFELDGNLVDESIINDPDSIMPPDDWGQVVGDGSTSGYVSGLGIDKGGDANVSSFIPDPNGADGNDNIFTGGGSKDDLPIEGWKWTINTPPDKDDLLAVGAASYLEEGELLIYDFGTLYAANGTSSIGNWFFKKDIGPCADGTFGVVDNDLDGRPCLDDADQPESLHSLGDVLIISENTNGGTQTNISVYTWVDGREDLCPDKGFEFVPPKDNLCKIAELLDATCDDDPNTDLLACGRMNQVSTESIDDYGYTPKSPPDPAAAEPAGTDGIQADDHPAYTFFESGINLTKVLNETACFSSFMKNTRTSASTRSQLKDFAAGSFALCGIAADKSCEAVLNDKGDTVDVDFKGTVSNTGAIEYDVLLYDSEYGSEITDVCYDLGGVEGQCDDNTTDPPPINLFLLPDGSATFTLPAGDTVLYEGDYTFTGTIDDLTFIDIVTAIASLNQKEVARAAPSADCEPIVDPEISVTKGCRADIVNADTFRAEIAGCAENIGNVKLVNVRLTDTVFASNDLTKVNDNNGNCIVDGGDTTFNGELAPGDKLAFAVTLTSQDQVSHTNTVTAYGTNVFNPDDTRNASATAQCEVNPEPSITITKVCNVTDYPPTGVTLVQKDGLVSVEVGNIIEVTNDGVDENLTNVVVSDSEMALSTTDTRFDCDTTPGVCVGSLELGASIVFTQTYYPDGDNIIGALLNPGSVFFKNTATASGDGVLSKLPTGTVEDYAECKICPPCPDCN